MQNTIYEYRVKDADGNDFDFSTLKGHVLLIVNTASKCGFTPQYEGLQKLYEDYREKEFTIIGFPCNQFLQQEPGSMEEIKSFCSLNYNVTFPIMAKVNVNGGDAAPIYQFLKKQAGGLFSREIKWNFTKFLINREGKVVKRYAPVQAPEGFAKDIEKLL